MLIFYYKLCISSPFDLFEFTVNSIKLEPLIPTNAPTVVPTISINNTNIYIPVRIIDSNSDISLLNKLQNNYDITITYDCNYPTVLPNYYNATTASPSQQPTIEPTIEDGADHTLIYFYDESRSQISFMFLLNYYNYDFTDDTIYDIYELCDLGLPSSFDVIYAAIDTIFTIPDFLCIDFFGKVLTPINDDSYNLQSKSYIFTSKNDAVCSPYSNNGIDYFKFQINTIEIGTYCS